MTDHFLSSSDDWWIMSSSPLRFLMIGTQVAASILIGSFIGRILDLQFDSAPWGFLGGFILGAVAGFRELVRAGRGS